MKKEISDILIKGEKILCESNAHPQKTTKQIGRMLLAVISAGFFEAILIWFAYEAYIELNKEIVSSFEKFNIIMLSLFIFFFLAILTWFCIYLIINYIQVLLFNSKTKSKQKYWITNKRVIAYLGKNKYIWQNLENIERIFLGKVKGIYGELCIDFNSAGLSLFQLIQQRAFPKEEKTNYITMYGVEKPSLFIKTITEYNKEYYYEDDIPIVMNKKVVPKEDEYVESYIYSPKYTEKKEIEETEETEEY